MKKYKVIKEIGGKENRIIGKYNIKKFNGKTPFDIEFAEKEKQ